MTDIIRRTQSTLRSHGGLVATHELYAAGVSRTGIRYALESRMLIRVRKGWYGHPDLPTPIIRAARVGGQLTCLSALATHRIWQYPCRELHVAVKGESSRLRRPASMLERLTPGDLVRVHWRLGDGETRLVLPIVDCLSDLLRCQSGEIAATAVDSALNRRLISPWDVDLLLAELSARRRAGLSFDGRCESGTETLVRIRMASLGIFLLPQVEVPGVGRVDFVAGDRLVIEVDGAEYHVDPVRFEADRRRDAELSRRGYRVLRFSYRMVMDDWALVEAAILASLIRGDHLR